MPKLSNKEMYYAIRDLGFKPRIEHIRFVNLPKAWLGGVTRYMLKDLTWIRLNNDQAWISAKGGETLCNVYDETGENLVYVSVAMCNLKDNYNKKIGVHIALARALEHLQNEATNKAS